MTTFRYLLILIIFGSIFSLGIQADPINDFRINRAARKIQHRYRGCQTQIHDLIKEWVPKDSVGIFGVSAQPPTLGHLTILTEVQRILGIRDIVFAPTRPYKPGVEGGTIALELSKIAVSNMDEFLTTQGIPFEHFMSTDDGECQFVTCGKPLRVRTSSLEFESEHVEGEGTIYFLPFYEKKYADNNPSKLFWISGADSFATIPKWTPRWKDFFKYANWVVISRAEYNHILNVSNDNPLEHAVNDPDWSDWLRSNFTHRRIATNVHFYQSREVNHPNIFVIKVNVPNTSSSAVREIFRSESDLHLKEIRALKIIPKSVYDIVVQRHLYH